MEGEPIAATEAPQTEIATEQPASFEEPAASSATYDPSAEAAAELAETAAARTTTDAVVDEAAPESPQPRPVPKPRRIEFSDDEASDGGAKSDSEPPSPSASESAEESDSDAKPKKKRLMKKSAKASTDDKQQKKRKAKDASGKDSKKAQKPKDKSLKQKQRHAAGAAQEKEKERPKRRMSSSGGSGDEKDEEDEDQTDVRGEVDDLMDTTAAEGNEEEESEGERAEYANVPEAVEETDKPRKRKAQFTEQEMFQIAIDFIEKMKEAAARDADLNREGQPALNKIRLLPEVVFQMNRTQFQTSFVEAGLFNAITSWLEPLPDGSMPAMKIRETLLQQLKEFYFSKEALKTSGIGKAVMAIFQNAAEPKALRGNAQTLINKWSRSIFQLSTEYAKPEHERQPPKRVHYVDPTEQVLASYQNTAQTLKPGEVGYRRHARFPMPSSMDFAVRPESTVKERVTGKGSGARSKPLFGLKPGKKGGGNTSNVSIEGREMLM